ncbi:MAG: SDR family NAD(P)-dependent oxidoreductase, partial [Gemmatimonadetes bacterium]|nr:SDR family NAD(P)-dependent oxidoreductase [Gemmatimonadota bacterium]
MRSLQVVMLMLCVLGGLFLLVRAPEFFLPAQWDPSIGRSFDPLASRLLGAGLLALAAAGAGYIHAMYYSMPRRLPGPAAQRRHFALLLAALVLIGAALARLYARRRARLLLIGRDEARLAEVAAACASEAALVETARADVRERAAMEAVLRDFDDRHPLDIVVANAGVTHILA